MKTDPESGEWCGRESGPESASKTSESDERRRNRRFSMRLGRPTHGRARPHTQKAVSANRGSGANPLGRAWPHLGEFGQFWGDRGQILANLAKAWATSSKFCRCGALICLARSPPSSGEAKRARSVPVTAFVRNGAAGPAKQIAVDMAHARATRGQCAPVSAGQQLCVGGGARCGQGGSPSLAVEPHARRTPAWRLCGASAVS